MPRQNASKCKHRSPKQIKQLTDIRKDLEAALERIEADKEIVDALFQRIEDLDTCLEDVESNMREALNGLDAYLND